LAGSGSVAQRLPQRERLILLAALAAISALSWLYLIRMPMVPADLGAVGARVLSVLPPRLADVWLTFMMWSVMMVAMMLPSASPMILTYAAIARRRPGSAACAPWIFAGAYLVIWTCFSAAATAGQLLLETTSVLYGASRTTSVAGAILLMVAGLYQLTPLKNACLAHCRAPAHFISRHWRQGSLGAAYTGMRLGVYCLGCCWVLMALLFAGGVMSLLWIAALVHRLSGLALAIFLPLHFLALGLAIRGEASLETFLRWSDQPLVKLAEGGLIFLLTVHLLGGLRQRFGCLPRLVLRDAHPM